ncbi:MAG: DUF4190 domain-containing protein [Phycisphaerales bacterium]|nr:DUF4190 domain-containing protein [Phycisphaerales bacterium]
MNYWIFDGVNQNGPYPLNELPQHGLHTNSLVWTEGMSQWQRASQVPAIQALLLQADPQPTSDSLPFEAAPPSVPYHPSTPPWQPSARPNQHVIPAQPVQTINYQSPYLPAHLSNANLPKGLAITSMVLGICSLFFLTFYCLGVLPAIFGVIFGHIARSQIKRGIASGGPMATAGLICSYIAFGLTLLGLIVFVVYFFFASGMYNSLKTP